MKRYPVVIGATVAGLAGVLTFHSESGTLSLGSGNSSSAHAPSQSRAAQTTPAVTPTSTGPPQGVTASATGAVEQYGYGELSVRVTMAGGELTKVALVTLQTAETYSQQLANQVVPVLQREVLASQSAHINALSGATYTSEAYAYSVQSALDKLHK